MSLEDPRHNSGSAHRFGMGARRPSFDPLLERLSRSLTSLSEPELLQESHWDRGQDARLREDIRFRRTPWGRWMRAVDFLGNDALHRELRSSVSSTMNNSVSGGAGLDAALAAIGRHFGRRCVLCPADPRLVVTDSEVRLAASELSTQPVIEEDVGELEKYTTHLPLHSLRAVAASEPAGEWGRGTQEQMIETLGWIRIVGQQRLNPRMFVARIEGHSMDDGRSGLVDGGYAMFELWPSGTRQRLNVLVRGSFHDPETGNYVLKKYVADPRDAEGRHGRITLVSLNPDKERYPDIELQAEDDEALAVVAKVVQALAPDDYARRPKPPHRPGRRELNTEEALQKIHAQLAERAGRFFEAVPGTSISGTSISGTLDAADGKPDTAVWTSRIVCLDAGAGGPHLEIGPLPGLWSFAKVLVLRGIADEPLRTLASNARLRPVRVPVRPADGAWHWGVDGFEDDPDIDLSALAVDGLPHDRVTVFAIGADGVGRRLAGDVLTPGRGYRLLVPPQVWAEMWDNQTLNEQISNDEVSNDPMPNGRMPDDQIQDRPDGLLIVSVFSPLTESSAISPSPQPSPPNGGEGTTLMPLITTPLADGWYLAELALPFAPSPGQVAELAALGLRIGDLTPSLTFGLASWPDEWRSTPRGEPFAAFAVGTDGTAAVFMNVDGYDAEVDGEARLFVHGPDGPQHIALPAGTSTTIELSGLVAGRYFATLLHQRVRVQPAHLPFELSAELAAPPQASWVATIAGTAHYGTPNTALRLAQGDLAHLQQQELFVEGPPGWGARVLWRELATDWLATFELDPSGLFDVPEFLRCTRERRERRPLGDLILDLAELGMLVLEHERHANPPDIGRRLGELVEKKGDFVRRRSGAYVQLLPTWFEPVAECLGYEVGPIAELPVDPPQHAVVATLRVTERHTHGIDRRCKRILVMLETLEPALDSELLAWIDGVCQQFGVDHALVSTGLIWANHHRRSRLPLKVWDLEEVLARENLLIGFLRDVAEGV